MTDELQADPAFRNDVLSGFALERRAVPARWLYDRAGSELFEEITRLPEYYPTRTETALLEKHGGDVAALAGPGRAVVEFGSGSSLKTPHILRAVTPAAYVPIDISGAFLRDSAAGLATEFTKLPIHPVEADFTQPVALPDDVVDMPKLGFFPGSTIGNMIARSSVDLLRSMRTSLGVGAQLLIGFDRIKSPDVLLPAYDDAKGVTARFSLNLLTRINRELDGTIPVKAFGHVAEWNDDYARIEAYLVPARDVTFEIAGKPFSMAQGERLHIENSHKYGLRDARLMLRAGGWSPVADWSDEQDWFTLILAEARAFRHAP